MGGHLAETIESVLRNLQAGDQYFVIDGGSTDDSVRVIHSYEHRLSGWISEPDGGYADALAKGFARCTGELLCWVNSGDVLLDGALERAREAFSETGADLLFGDDFYIDERGLVLRFSRGYVRSLRDMMLLGGWTPLQDACFWRRELYERIGGMDNSLKYAADYDLFLRMSLQGTSRYVPITFSAFRQHSGQKSIAYAHEYGLERECCRARELAGQHATRAIWRRIYYRSAAWWRARVLARFWDVRVLVGRPIHTLPSACYYGVTGDL